MLGLSRVVLIFFSLVFCFCIWAEFLVAFVLFWSTWVFSFSSLVIWDLF